MGGGALVPIAVTINEQQNLMARSFLFIFVWHQQRHGGFDVCRLDLVHIGFL